ncbi:RHS repeat domain-containing protein [Flavobacterium branchiophilum]|uniref:RHS repeat domain-containing protein n=1 Tax=Flavobacterium branchiophilum TaxID=55197 RepID=UPI0023EEFDB6|nr:RHS repeat-associated core domain-containing protein [Flavobacterium branchiophilum]
MYGNLRNLRGERSFIPFRQLGQYEDVETGLYYNRFRYYNPDSGLYISQDPIGLKGGNPNFYSYTKNSNYLVDLFGLDPLGTGAPLKNGFLFYKNELSLWTIYHKNVDAIMAHVHLGILAYWLVNTIRYQLKQQKSHHNFMVKIMMMK